MALSVIAVSISVSPLRMDDWPTDMFITSAPSRLPANSNEDCVLVEDFEEHIDLGAAAQRGALFLDLPVEFDEFLGEVEQAVNLIAGKPFDPQQVLFVEDER